MNREDIEQWTREAGGFDATPEFLKRFAEFVARAEREACAKVCEDSVEYAGDTLAEAIRYRGEA